MTAPNNPIADAVNPSRQEAIDRAVNKALDFVESAKKLVEEHGGDLDKAAPRPSSNMTRNAYIAQLRRRQRLDQLFEYVGPPARRHRDPYPVLLSAKLVARFLDGIREAAAADFDLYIRKLTKKVGDGVVKAELYGALWSGSVLTVTKVDGSTERWSTKQIINVSSLGLLFNQWPTRLMKG